MGRNRRQQRLRDKRSRPSESPAPEAPRRSSGGALSAKPKPAWRETIDSWGGFTVIGAIAAAVIIGALLVFLNRPGSSANTEAFVPHERDVPVAGTMMGDPNAPVRIIGYADFQCPFCKAFADTIEPTIIDEYVATGIASFEFRNYAFLGTESLRAASAAACAADQNRFWDFHDLLLLRQGRQNSGVFSDNNLKQYARTIGGEFSDFNVSEWETCFDSGVYESDIEQEAQIAANSGVSSTPTVVINGRIIGGLQGIDTYRTAIEAAAEGSGP